VLVKSQTKRYSGNNDCIKRNAGLSPQGNTFKNGQIAGSQNKNAKLFVGYRNVKNIALMYIRSHSSHNLRFWIEILKSLDRIVLNIEV